MDCSNVQIKYAGNGQQVLYTFPFEYMDETDIWVGLWNDNSNRWEEIHDWLDLNEQPDIIAPYYWTFDNPTTIRFLQNTNPTTGPASPVGPPADWAPPTPDVNTTEKDGANILIQRRSEDNDLVEFYPGSSIRAQDLNYNFEQLLYLIQEGRCVVPSWFLDYIDAHINRITEQENRDGDWTNGSALDDDEHYATAAALTDRYDPFWQGTLPEGTSQPTWRMPGKIWVDRNANQVKFWNQQTGVWETFVGAGTPGPRGNPGPPGSFQVSDTPPLSVPIPGATAPDPTSRALENGDAWFNSLTGNLFVWYVDNNSSQWLNCSQAGPQGADGQRQRVFAGDTAPLQIDGEAVQAGDLWFHSDEGQLYLWYTDNNSSQWVNISGTPGPQGPPGADGAAGGANFARLTAVAPMRVALSNANQDAEISIDLSTINGLP